MKTILIKKHCTTRAKIEKIAKSLNVGLIGSREHLLSEISKKSYSEIKKAINAIN